MEPIVEGDVPVHEHASAIHAKAGSDRTGPRAGARELVVKAPAGVRRPTALGECLSIVQLSNVSAAARQEGRQPAGTPPSNPHGGPNVYDVLRNGFPDGGGRDVAVLGHVRHETGSVQRERRLDPPRRADPNTHAHDSPRRRGQLALCLDDGQCAAAERRFCRGCWLEPHRRQATKPARNLNTPCSARLPKRARRHVEHQGEEAQNARGTAGRAGHPST